MDILSIAGIIVGFAALAGGNFLEGGHLNSLLNGPAILIVLGGSMGATFLQVPPAIFHRSMLIIIWIFKPKKILLKAQIKKILSWSTLARKEGLLGLESIASKEKDAFAKKGLQLLVDGNEPEVIRECLEVELMTKETLDLQAAKVYDAVGGYCPTFGIIGAIMGLIHVMQNLSDPKLLGAGIATAFVATIYGVGLANLLFLPIASKLKTNVQNYSHAREMLAEGIVAIAEGENPRNIELKLTGFLDDYSK